MVTRAEGTAGVPEGIPTKREFAIVIETMILKGKIHYIRLREIMNTLSEHFDIALKDLYEHKNNVRGPLESFMESD